MAIDPQHRRSIFQNLDRQLGKLKDKAEADHVHKFRTYSRRVETFLENLSLEKTGNDKKLLKMLERLRKKAGKVRDLDVQISALENLRIASHQDHKNQLLREMRREREAREKKLMKAFTADTIAELRRRLRRTAHAALISEKVNPLERARALVAELGQDRVPLTEKRLHQYRLTGKRARYLAEFATASPEAIQFINQLKRMQDVIGDWHDWLELTARAEDLFGGAHNSALVAMLQNLTRAKFRNAVRVLSETQQSTQSGPGAQKTSTKRKPFSVGEKKLTAFVA